MCGQDKTQTTLFGRVWSHNRHEHCELCYFSACDVDSACFDINYSPLNSHKIHVSLAKVSRTVEMFPWPGRVTHVSRGLPSVLTGTTWHQTTPLNWRTLAMHAGTLVARPLTVLGAILQIALYDGNIAQWKSVSHRKKTKVCMQYRDVIWR